MSGYTPVFSSVFDGTLHGRWPHTGVWLCLLAMADRYGHIDRAPRAIASDIGCDVPTLLECIADFCAPDPDSRTAESDGRRMELIDPARPWGWRIVNHGKYREKARKMAFDQSRAEDGRNAERMRDRRRPPETAGDPTGPAKTRANPPSDSDTNTDSEKNPPSGEEAPRKRAGPRRKHCPDDFGVPDSELARMRAECPDVDLLAQTRRFRDHEFVRPKSDWLAAWRNWMREEQSRAVKSQHRPRPTRYEELMARMDSAEPAPAGEVTQFLLGGKA